MTPRRFAVVAGGGTGGHVLQALAVARALTERGHPADSIELMGSQRGQEATLLAGQGFPVRLLPGRGIRRQLSVEATVSNLEATAGLAQASGRALADLRARRPDVVVTVGGYAALPAGLAARTLGVPLVVLNVDAVPGAVNRMLGRFATACAVAFPGTPLPRATVTGAAVRREITAVDRSPEGQAEARRALGLPTDRQILGFFGGSIGARRINQAAVSLAGLWASRGDVALYQVTGRQGHDEVRRSMGEGMPEGPLVHRVVAFEDRMALLYQAADLLVCRAGAMTVAELTVAGVPAVLVPLPGAPGDHQTHNAEAVVAVGGAVLLPDERCTGDELGRVAGSLLEDPAALAAMGKAAATLGRADAAERIADLVEEVAGARAG